MSRGVVLSRNAARRTRDVVRLVEAGGVPKGKGRTPSDNRVYVEIVTEVGSGEYTAKAVKRDGDAWVVRTNDIFTDESVPIFEANGVDGLDVGTVVEVYRLYDSTEEEKYWVFFATGGGGGTVPVTIGTKVATPGKVWNCEVFANGIDSIKTEDSTVRILDIDEDAVFAVGEEPSLLAVKIGNRYEGQIPVWLCT